MPVTLAVFFAMLESFDWYYHYSDDGREWRAGVAQEKVLKEIATQSPEHQQLYDAWYAYHFTGAPWGNEKAPRPTLDVFCGGCGGPMHPVVGPEGDIVQYCGGCKEV